MSERIRIGVRERRWRWWHVALLVPFYAVISWQPVNMIASGNGAAFGVRGWPMLTLQVTWLVSIVAAVFVWSLFLGRLRIPTWLCALVVVAGYGAAVYVYLQWVGHYAPVTDRATALEIGWRALSSGENPYRYETQLNNGIAPMIGGILFAGPFVQVFGDLWWYGITWLAVAFALLWKFAGPRAAAAVALLAPLTPTVRYELYSQSDAWINAFYLVLFGSIGFALAGRAGERRLLTVAFYAVAVLFGAATAYRFIFAPAVLPLIVVMWRAFGFRRTAHFFVPAGLVSAALILTPWIVDPAIYAPVQKINHADSDTVPYFGLILMVAVVAVFVIGSLISRTLVGVWGTTAVGLSVMILLLVWGRGGWHTYEAVAYNGATFVFLLAALILPRYLGIPPAEPLTTSESDLRSAAASQGSAAQQASLSVESDGWIPSE